MTNPKVTLPDLLPRNDLTSMLLPLFPESTVGTSFETEIDGHKITISIDSEHRHLPTQADSRVLAVIAGALARSVRAGITPSRELVVPARPMLEILAGDRVSGGEDYARLRRSLERLMGVVIETEHPLAFGKKRFKRLRLIDAFGYDHAPEGDGFSPYVSINVTISDDLFSWIMHEPGIDTAPNEYRRLTATPGSTDRIFRIMVAGLIKGRTDVVRMPIDELRQRIPLSSDLKVFKARTLKQSMKIIDEDPYMSNILYLALERRTDDGFVDINGQRCPLKDIYLAAYRREIPHDWPNCLNGAAPKFIRHGTGAELDEEAQM